MSIYFDLFEVVKEMRSARMYSKRFEHMLTYKLNSLRELCGRLPEEGEIFFIETKKSFTAFTFIVYVLKQTGRIDDLYIATYSTNERIINALLRWYDRGVLGNIHLHISETIKFRMPKIYDKLRELESQGIIQLSFAWSHKTWNPKESCCPQPSCRRGTSHKQIAKWRKKKWMKKYMQF